MPGTKGRSDQQAESADLELSVVIPCLKEADTIGVCVEKAQRALRENGIADEIVVADNGSTDGSQNIAISKGARVIGVAMKGYGNALMGGIAAARGPYIIMGTPTTATTSSRSPGSSKSCARATSSYRGAVCRRAEVG